MVLQSLSFRLHYSSAPILHSPFFLSTPQKIPAASWDPSSSSGRASGGCAPSAAFNSMPAMKPSLSSFTSTLRSTTPLPVREQRTTATPFLAAFSSAAIAASVRVAVAHAGQHDAFHALARPGSQSSRRRGWRRNKRSPRAADSARLRPSTENSLLVVCRVVFCE